VRQNQRNEKDMKEQSLEGFSQVRAFFCAIDGHFMPASFTGPSGINTPGDLITD
jgi:hypothetical protein